MFVYTGLVEAINIVRNHSGITGGVQNEAPKAEMSIHVAKSVAKLHLKQSQ